MSSIGNELLKGRGVNSVVGGQAQSVLERPSSVLLKRQQDKRHPRTVGSFQISGNSLSGQVPTVRYDERKTKALVRVKIVCKAAIHGDLDWITMKALEKDRTRRYGTPSELAADITRYLNHEPVVARPASTGYRLQKYVRRHRVGVAVVAGLVMLLAAFVAMQSVQLRRTTRERDRATRITDFMTSMFKVSDPSEARGNSITAREILDKASKDIDTGLAKDPETQAQMMNVMGDVYQNLGLYPRAQALDQQSMEIRQRVLGPQHPDTMNSLNSLVSALGYAGHLAAAEKLIRDNLPIARRVLGPEHPQTLKLTNNLAGTLDLEGHYAEAEKIGRVTLDAHRRVFGPESRETLFSMNNLAVALVREGRLADAEKLWREMLDIQRRTLGPENPQTVDSMNNLANVLGEEGHFADAEKFGRETLDARRRVLGPEHPETLISMGNLANTLSNEGHYAEAQKMFRETLDIMRRVLGPEHPATVQAVYNLGCAVAHTGTHTEALSLLRESVDLGLPPSQALQMEKDPDLKSLHGDPRFDALVAHAKEVAQSKNAAAQKQN